MLEYLQKQEEYMLFNLETAANIELTKKALGEPFLLEFTEYARKVRNNLMFLGILSTLIVYEKINISSKSSLFGLQLEGWNMHLIYVVLFSLVAYFLVHFIWLAWDYFVEWRLRLTGTHINYPNQYLPDGIDYGNDLRQTTLYSWWLQSTKEIKSFREMQESIENSFREINKENSINSTRVAQEQYLNIVNNLSAINQNISIFTATLEKARIPASLEKFDSTFLHFQKSQGWRWAIIELYIPILIGVFALSWLSTVI